MRNFFSGFTVLVASMALLGGCGPASELELQSTRSALTASATFLDLTATIEVPDTIEPDTEFPVTVSGVFSGGNGWSVTAWSLWENAVWFHNGDMVEITSGTFIAGHGFNWGANFDRTFLLTRPAGTYTYTFVFGRRSPGHYFRDVAVDITATVASEPVVCDLDWHQSLDKKHRAGRTLPLKFTAFECATGQFLHDEGVHVDVYAPDGTLFISWDYTGNPPTGIDIDDVAQQYQINWQTPNSQGAYAVVVTFSSGEQLTGTITLE